MTNSDGFGPGQDTSTERRNEDDATAAATLQALYPLLCCVTPSTWFAALLRAFARLVGVQP